MTHTHAFNDWPFHLAVNTGVFTTRQIMDGREPIREVYHEPDGDWQFLSGTDWAPEDVILVCLGCIVERDITVGELADMPPSWCATRPGPGAEWIQEPFEANEE